MIDKDTFTYAAPDLPKWQRVLIKSVERMTGQLKIWRLYNEYSVEQRRSDESFWDVAVRKLELTLKYDREKLAKIPKTGPLVVVANHPYGVLDGVILSGLMDKIRCDYKVLTNSVLCQIEEVQGHLLEIDFAQTEEALKTNLATRSAARAVLKQGGAIAVFPAGGVSTIPTWKDKVAQDTAWQTFVAGLIQVSEANVVPIFFEGQNSRLFQLASLFSSTIRLSLFFKEVADKIGWTIGVRIGDVIPYKDLAHIKERAELCHHLREVTYKLGGMETLPPPKAAYSIDAMAHRKKEAKK